MRPSPQMIRDVREYPVLYVDDEPENLRIFELTFRREFSIFTATSGEEGLEILHTKPVALVVSDHRMPGMTGTEFLARAAELDPSTVRIMVTAYGDAETLQDAINNGAIYRFIPKPWNPDDVRATLLRGIESYALERERSQLLQELTVLNTVSRALNRELGLERLLELLMRVLREEMGYDGASVWLRDADTGTLCWMSTSVACDEIDERLAGMCLTHENASDFLCKLEDGHSLTLHADELLEYPSAVRDWMTEVAAEEIVVSPLYGKDGLIGAITVDNRRGGKSFRADDVTLIEGISNQASIAVDNARLVEDLRRSREQVRHSDRLGALGTLASGVATEIDEPLEAVDTFLRAASEQRGPDGDDFWGEPHANACRALDRIRAMVGAMGRLALGSGPGLREPVDVNEVGAAVVSLLHREAELGHVDLRLDGAAELPKIPAVREQIHQLLLHLVLNALAMTPAEGAVRVRTSPQARGDEIVIDVCDSGPGVEAERLEQAFDPFSDEPALEGDAGLGLAVCHRIVVEHGGSLEVCEADGGGAAFRVRLPTGDGPGPA